MVEDNPDSVFLLSSYIEENEKQQNNNYQDKEIPELTKKKDSAPEKIVDWLVNGNVTPFIRNVDLNNTNDEDENKPVTSIQIGLNIKF